MFKIYRRLFVFFALLSIIVPIAQGQAEPPYKDVTLSVEERVNDLLGRMTLDEKIGQMTLVEVNSIRWEDISEMAIGGILSGGGGSPNPNTPEEWAARTEVLVRESLTTRLAIPLIYGVDAVHGHNNISGAVIFPHNIGLGATHNPELVRRIGQATACDLLASGIPWNYAPVLAVPQDIRWGRTYEGYAQDTELVTELGIALLEGMQGESIGDLDSVLATAKHFVGDGGAQWGTARTGRIDQGDMIVDEATLRAIHLPPYIAAVESGVMSVMASFSSWNGRKMHAQKYLLTDVLKDELGFEGFIVSDWQAIDQISPNYYHAVVVAINAGIDMNMVPYDYPTFIATLRSAVDNGDVPIERIDDAVRRILRVKFMLGLFDDRVSSATRIDNFSQQTYRDLARAAVSQSLVLLQNENDVLPLSSDLETVLLVGAGADNVGMQAGGWTVTWQGASGRLQNGTSIRDGIEALVSDETTVLYDLAGRFDDIPHADVAIVVIGEEPYAEGLGDKSDLSLSPLDVALIEQMSAMAENVVVVLLSGRPLLITDHLDKADAWVAAWLPGSEGQGVADVLFGLHPFTGTLSYYWPRSMAQIPLDVLLTSADDPLFAIGAGITTGSNVEITLPTIECS